MKSFVFVLCFGMFFFTACTQSRNIPKAYAFVQHQNFGTIAVDQNGNQLSPGSHTDATIYLESNITSALKINEVIFNSTVYKNPQVSLSGKKKIVVGNSASNHTSIYLTPLKGNNLWRIEISNIKGSTQSTADMQVEKAGDVPLNKIIIMGKKDGKPFSITVNSVVELQGRMAM